jgi:glucosamine--fructose-6-phosphate aminotransferase (isomerizing)
MCGIFTYLGKKDAAQLIIEGLKKLEYRGYDSAGLVVLNDTGLHIQKCQGKVSDLEKISQAHPLKGGVGMGHTRWATHGKPSEINSHPHKSGDGSIVVIHNGIIENYDTLKSRLSKAGHVFHSETDTEVIAYLIEHHYKSAGQKNFTQAVFDTLKEVEGSYALAVVCSHEPDKMIVAKKFSPLVIGVGQGEIFAASDVMPILPYTNQVIYLADGEVAVLTLSSYQVFNLAQEKVEKTIKTIAWDIESASKGSYAHYMLKEIFEQNRAIQDTIQGRITREQNEVLFDGLNMSLDELRKIERIIFVACGTSWHASLIGEFYIEEVARIPVEVEYAAEFRYRNPIIPPHTLVIAISQSGETADTIAAVGEAQANGAKVISICNVVDSTIARDSDGVIYTFAGPEIGVASTKAFTTQITVLYLFSIFMGRLREALPPSEAKILIENLRHLPTRIQEVLEKTDVEIQRLAKVYAHKNNFLYLGRGVGYPIALEGALKLKEISYIHAEGYPAAEMKHGPIALIDENMPTIVLAFKGRRYEKVIGNVMEVKARKGIVIAIATEGNKDIASKVDEVIYIPHASEFISPILAVIPLQLLAYYIAVEKKCSVDQPRNLAKSVTVE